MERITLEVRRGETGLWFVTSPDPRGLLVVGHSRREALEKIDGALEELAEAMAEATAPRTCQEADMQNQTNFQNQREIDGGCKCGWTGKVPTELQVNLGGGRLLCPRCLADFKAWPPVSRT